MVVHFYFLTRIEYVGRWQVEEFLVFDSLEAFFLRHITIWMGIKTVVVYLLVFHKLLVVNAFQININEVIMRKQSDGCIGDSFLGKTNKVWQNKSKKIGFCVSVDRSWSLLGERN